MPSPRAPILRASFLRSDELVIDSFAGGGGASTGIEAAIGRPVDIAINHSPEAIAMHRANHPHTRHFCENIWQVAPRDATGGRPVGLLWASPDCFPAGTMVLTRTGYRPIEEIAVGDEVLTHELRWRRVTATMNTTKQLVMLRGRGHPGLLVSSEHPFLARKRACLHRGWALIDPQWTKAGELGKGWYWGSPTSFPVSEPPPVQGRGLDADERLMWLAGRYLADGWTRLTSTRAELVITCGAAKVLSTRERLSVWPRAGARCEANELAWSERDTATAHQFTANHRGLVAWLREQFGHGAAAKLIPGWALGMAEPLRVALLNGYLSGDGHTSHGDGNPVVMATTVSKALAFGLKALAGSLGFAPCVYFSETNHSQQIQGRDISARPAWHVRWRSVLDAGHRQTVCEDGIEWAPIRSMTDAAEYGQVFNLSVEDDESYVAEGIIVHNCTHFSRAKGSAKRSDGRRGLAHVVIRWAHDVRPRVILLENVPEFQTWGPLDSEGQPDPKRAGSDFRAWLSKLTALGYQVEWRELVAADYGTPTTRKRLFLVARCDGAPISWPEQTHGRGRSLPWRTAAEIIDWSIPCPSIFERSRPLADATMRRIAEGLRRYVIEADAPFIVPGPGATEQRAPSKLVAAWLTKHYGGVVGHGVTRPIGTVTAKDHHSLTTASLVPAATGIDRADHSEQVLAFLISYYGTGTGQPCTDPLRTVTTRDRFGLVMVRGEPYTIADIGMRMLSPRELYAAQGFPADYQIETDADGRAIPKTVQIALAGNSVCPPVAAALVAANIPAARSMEAA